MTVSPHAPSPGAGLRTDDDARTGAADDFGHLVHRRPAGVLVPRSADDVAAAIGWCARRGLPFAARGRGHSTYGRAQAPDGLVAELSSLAAVGAVEDDSVVAGAGATWREVLRTTLAVGRTPPVLTDYLDLSVGGTLAVGGIGALTATSGAQTDHVLALEVVTGRGDVVTCSPTERADLFDAVRAGLGQVAVITRARLRLRPAPAAVRRFVLGYPHLTALLSDARLLWRERRFEALQGMVTVTPSGGLAFALEAASFGDGSADRDGALLAGLSDDRARREAATMAPLDFLGRLDALESDLRAAGEWAWPHPWLNTFVGDSCVERVVAAELARMEPLTDLGPRGRVLLSPVPAATIASPLLRLPSEASAFTFSLIRLPPTGDRAEAERLVAENGAVYERVRAAGGTLYPVSALPLPAAAWREHFGPAFAPLQAARRRFDPAGTLTPGYEVFARPAAL